MENSPLPATLTRETILKAMSALNEKLAEEEVIGEICIFGGTAMMLAFNARLSTRDVDAIFKPPEVIRKSAREVASHLGLSEDWLNDGVKGYVSGAPAYTSDNLPQLSHLRMIRPTAEYLLAMKCMASRSPSYTTKGDRDDILFLLKHLGLRDANAVFEIMERFYDSRSILPRAHFMIEELLGPSAGLHSSADPSNNTEPLP